MKIKSYQEILKSTRRTWGDIKPVTKIIPNKKKNKKEKYKNNYEQDY